MPVLGAAAVVAVPASAVAVAVVDMPEVDDDEAYHY